MLPVLFRSSRAVTRVLDVKMMFSGERGSDPRGAKEQGHKLSQIATWMPARDKLDVGHISVVTKGRSSFFSIGGAPPKRESLRKPSRDVSLCEDCQGVTVSPSSGPLSFPRPIFLQYISLYICVYTFQFSSIPPYIFILNSIYSLSLSQVLAL